MTTQKIVPHLWFDKDAVEATALYTSLFADSRVTGKTVIHDTPSGDCDMVTFELFGQSFLAISAGPYFKPNPSVSFTVNFDPVRYEASNGASPSCETQAKNALDEAWAGLSLGGKVLMPLGEYPFSKYYGWIEDKYGFSWQLILTNPEGEVRPAILPSFLFTGAVCGKAEEASDFYLSIFPSSLRGIIARYGAGQEPNEEGTVMFTDFMLASQWFVAMDSAAKHDFSFNESVSFVVSCDTQEEIDFYWEKLSAHPESEQCGWLKDKYGVSWQIVPSSMNEMMTSGDEDAKARVTQAFLKMKKFDIKALEEAYAE